jgi:hypothetical protein
MMGSRKVDK